MLQKIGAEAITSNPYTPQQNGLAVSTNRTICNLARTMLISAKLPKSLWAEAVQYAVYVLNLTTICKTTGKSAYETIYKRKRPLKILKPYGAKCYLYDQTRTRHKWDPKSIPGVLVGYSGEHMDGYRVWLPGTNVVKRSKDVIFSKKGPFEEGEADEEQPQTSRTTETENENHASEDEDQKKTDEDQEKESEGQQEQEQDEEEVPRVATRRDRSKLKKPARYGYEAAAAEATPLPQEPLTLEEALKSPYRDNWKKAMEEELNSMKKHGVWTLTEPSSDHKPIGCRWVFKLKTNPKGEIDRFRARLVVKGYSQREGIDYSELFSPVARFDTIRTILSISASQHLALRQFDIKTAFLYGDLKEEVYMVQPLGFEDGTTKVCRLQKSLYGLKQAPRCFNKKFQEVLLSLGLIQSQADHCVFYRRRPEGLLVLAIYVDDALVAATSDKLIDEILVHIQKTFEFTGGPLSYFLGIHIQKTADQDIILHQEKYVYNTLDKFGMANCKPVATPADANLYSLTTEEKDDGNTKPYKELIGTLMYLAVCTRPDIAFAVAYLSRFLDNHSHVHWIAALRILRYLKGTPTLSLRYSSKAEEALEVYSDADFASDKISRRSVSGQIVKLNGAPILWGSTQQKTISLSTTEAEFIAATEVTKSVIWLKQLFRELLCEITPTIQIDNQSAIKFIRNPEFHQRTKHIDVKYAFIREKIENGDVKLDYVPSEYQLADLLTKPLSKVTFQKLRDLIGQQ